MDREHDVTHCFQHVIWNQVMHRPPLPGCRYCLRQSRVRARLRWAGAGGEIRAKAFSWWPVQHREKSSQNDLSPPSLCGQFKTKKHQRFFILFSLWTSLKKLKLLICPWLLNEILSCCFNDNILILFFIPCKDKIWSFNRTVGILIRKHLSFLDNHPQTSLW